MVVGFETLQDATFEDTSNKKRHNDVKASVLLQHATGGLAPARDLELNASHSKKATESNKTQYEGERIYTIAFRSIKFSYWKKGDVDSASIGKRCGRV